MIFIHVYILEWRCRQPQWGILLRRETTPRWPSFNVKRNFMSTLSCVARFKQTKGQSWLQCHTARICYSDIVGRLQPLFELVRDFIIVSDYSINVCNVIWEIFKKTKPESMKPKEYYKKGPDCTKQKVWVAISWAVHTLGVVVNKYARFDISLSKNHRDFGRAWNGDDERTDKAITIEPLLTSSSGALKKRTEFNEPHLNCLEHKYMCTCT